MLTYITATTSGVEHLCPRVRRTFLALVIVAVLSVGALSTALDAQLGSVAVLANTASALVLAASMFLACGS